MFNVLKYTSYVLVIIGALNWGFIGGFNFNLVEFLFGYMTVVARIIYAVIGVAAIVSVVTVWKCHSEKRCCDKEHM